MAKKVEEAQITYNFSGLIDRWEQPEMFAQLYRSSWNGPSWWVNVAHKLAYMHCHGWAGYTPAENFRVPSNIKEMEAYGDAVLHHEKSQIPSLTSSFRDCGKDVPVVLHETATGRVQWIVREDPGEESVYVTVFRKTEDADGRKPVCRLTMRTARRPFVETFSGVAQRHIDAFVNILINLSEVYQMDGILVNGKPSKDFVGDIHKIPCEPDPYQPE